MKIKLQFLIAIGLTLLFFLPLIGCDLSPQVENGEILPPDNTISWDEAKDHIGERTTVCGSVVDTRWASSSKGKPTFLNIGKPYPDSDRFTVVIWIDNRANFPQPPEGYYLGKTICVTGLITEYNGIPQIEATTSKQIEEI